MRIATVLLSLAAGLACAGPTALSRRQAAPKKLVVSSPGQVTSCHFDGTKFEAAGTPAKAEGMHFSWLVFKEPNHLYGANENNNEVRHWTVGADGTVTQEGTDQTGSTGVVHTAWNKDQTVLVGTAYGSNGTIDVWDVAQDGSLKLRKSVPVPALEKPGPNAARQEAPHCHQAVLEPAGGFFAINDLGSDMIHVLSTTDYSLVNHVATEPGCGPRHGGFVGRPGQQATHYLVACELSNKVLVYALTHDAAGGNLQLSQTQSLSTFAAGTAPAAGAAAGELVVSDDLASVYVTNRLTGAPADSVAHFSLGECGTLAFVAEASSLGRSPRMASLSRDQTVLFSTNVGKGDGDNVNRLVARSRGADGALGDALAVEKLTEAELAATDFLGPSFVQEIA
jgi:6-phosphogluconolactonase (cycloisomerase 2 family)